MKPKAIPPPPQAKPVGAKLPPPPPLVALGSTKTQTAVSSEESEEESEETEEEEEDDSSETDLDRSHGQQQDAPLHQAEALDPYALRVDLRENPLLTRQLAPKIPNANDSLLS